MQPIHTPVVKHSKQWLLFVHLCYYFDLLSMMCIKFFWFVFPIVLVPVSLLFGGSGSPCWLCHNDLAYTHHIIIQKKKQANKAPQMINMGGKKN